MSNASADHASPSGSSGKLVVHAQVMNPPASTSGRRLHAWGSLHATAVHFIIGVSWYCGASPDQMHSLYGRIYTDVYR
jgi:hypothetical protein